MALLVLLCWGRTWAEEEALPPPRAALAAELPWLHPAGTWEADAGFRFLQSRPAPFDDSGGSRTERDVAGFDLRLAGSPAGRTEISLTAGVLDTGGAGGTEGFVASDTRVAFAVALAGGPGSRTAVAGRFTAKVPTAPEDGEAGTDESDLGFAVSGGWRGGRLGLFGSAGLDMLGNPLRNGSQDDVATYGAGGWWRASERFDLVAEVEGRAFSRFGNSAGRMLLGGEIRSGGHARGRGLSGFALLNRGLTGDAARWGFSLGLSIRKF